jgi:hypothetical protein
MSLAFVFSLLFCFMIAPFYTEFLPATCLLMTAAAGVWQFSSDKIFSPDRHRKKKYDHSESFRQNRQKSLVLPICRLTGSQNIPITVDVSKQKNNKEQIYAIANK